MTKKEKGFAIFIGCAVFAIFALVLEGACNSLILSGGRAAALMQKPVLFGLFGGLMAGLFEESGRFVAFKTVLKKTRNDNSTALYYGAGHAGFEVFYIIVTTIITIVMADKLPAQAQAQVQGQSPLMYLVAVIERIPAIALHISLSVVVWFAVKNKGQFYLYPAAILIHMLFDAVAGTLSLMKVNIAIIEVLFYVMAVPVICLAIALWKKNSSKKEESEV